MAIVTFSRQANLISSILKVQFGDEVLIPVRGNDSTWEYLGNGSRGGKQRHISSAACELRDEYKVSITRKSTLLLDDDVENIRAALEAGVRAVPYFPLEERRYY